ncbi:unnamed protein product [Phytophthora fragariaefolia]|uniref:Unnamed protein product n=1 Tax=Phytophthora fragariaefolia TaxID=1490495 RepID=A0A9W6WP98_9STRA|nr:unnamed protein product [Phytophthora fragariaefolia]
MVNEADQSSIVGATRRRWIDWITACNLPFSWCEDGTVTKYTTHARISTETQLKYATQVVQEAKLTLDWRFLLQLHDGRVDKLMLAFVPLIDDDATDHTAASRGKFLKGILPYFNRHVTDIIYLVAENYAVNRKVADLLEVHLVGYASHRLNLGAQLFMADHASLLDKLQSLMRKNFTDLRPVLSQETSWDSTYMMVKRFFAIQDFIDTTDDDVAELMLTRHEENKLLSLQEDLRDNQSASKKLQSDEDVTLLNVRDIIDALIERHPVVAKYLAVDASIV